MTKGHTFILVALPQTINIDGRLGYNKDNPRPKYWL